MSSSFVTGFRRLDRNLRLMGAALRAQEHGLSVHAVLNVPPVRLDVPPGRNDLCSCGSGKKYKRCCLRKG